jgi:hypothetical protein
LHLKVTNAKDRPVYLCTPLVTFDKRARKAVADPKRIYAAWERPGVLELSKRVWPLPKGIQVFAPEMPRLTRLDPGQEHVEAIPLASPLPLSFPYMGSVKRSSHAKRSQARSLVVRLGYLPDGAEGVSPAEDGLYQVSQPLGLRQQKLLEKTLDVGLEVSERPELPRSPR